MVAIVPVPVTGLGTEELLLAEGIEAVVPLRDGPEIGVVELLGTVTLVFGKVRENEVSVKGVAEGDVVEEGGEREVELERTEVDISGRDTKPGEV